MVEQSSVKQADSKISQWLESNLENYEEDYFIIYNGINGVDASFTIGDLNFTLTLEEGLPVEINTKSKQSKVLDWVQDCNERLIMREFSNIEKALTFVFNKYQSKMKASPKKGSADENDDADMDYEDNQDNGFEEGEEQEDGLGEWESAMTNNNPNQQRSNNNGDDDSSIYRDLINKQKQEEILEQQKKLGKLGGSGLEYFQNILNTKCISIFEQSGFYQEAAQAQEYLRENEKLLKGWLNVAIVKEFLTVKLEIDLNHIGLHPGNAALLGYDINEPLIIVFSGKETKYLNADEDLESLTFHKVWNYGMLEFSCSNAQKQDQYGCRDYVRLLIEKYVEKYLGLDPQENEEQKQEFFKKFNTQQDTRTKDKKSKGGFFSGFKHFFNADVDDEALSQLVEMGYEVEIAKPALKKAGSDIHKALDILREDSYGEKQANTDETTFTGFQQLPATSNKLIQLMLFMSDSLEKATRYCFICLQDLEGESIKMRTCNKEYCEYCFEESFSGQVYPELKYQIEEAGLDISLAAKALYSTRATTVLEPFPTFFLKNTEMRSKRGYLDNIKQVQLAGKNVNEAKKVDEKNKDIEKMMNIFDKIPSPKELLDKSHNEESLREYLRDTYKGNTEQALLAYKFLAYILATNRTTIKELKNEEKVQTAAGDYFRQFILTSSDPNKERIFTVNKQKHGSFYCWHGSSMENWFSILRNGLRNLSNSHMMTAGAAYGQGIYASANYATSYGYSTRYSQGAKYWSKNTLGNNYLIAIVEIINKPEYKKDPQCNIVVVPDENDIILRYLFMYGQQGTYPSQELVTSKMNFEEHYKGYIHKLNKQKQKEKQERINNAYKKYLERKKKEIEMGQRIAQDLRERKDKEESQQLDNQIEKMKNKVVGKGSAMSTQRILIEYKSMLQSKDFKSIMKIDMIKDNIYTWRISFNLSDYEISKELRQDFIDREKQYKLPQEINYEIIFSDQYPHDPVFIRVITPRFRYQTGHVTVGGSICMESLTPSGWTSARSLESYFIEILSLLNAGGARLDLHNNNAYSIQEAREAFNRVARQHGWLK